MWGNENSKEISLAWFLIVAALFHALLWQMGAGRFDKLSLPGRSAKKKDIPEPLTIERYHDDEQKPVVRTDKAESDPKRLKEKARFAGEFDNRVEEETISPRTGKFLPGGVILQQRRGQVGEKTKPITPPEEDGDTVNADQEGLQGTNGLHMSDLMQFGASPNKLPGDIKDGANTMLNTDGVKYASYINRIADEIYEPWVTLAQEAARLLVDGGRKFDESTYITKLGVSLNAEGNVTAIQVLQSSGFSVFDEASKKAFWSSEPFPNPPQQLFDQQRRIKLVYEFHFEWKSSFFNISPRRI